MIPPPRERAALRSCMRESDLLSHILERSRGQTRAFPHVLAGPGDDCAVLAPGGEQLLLKVDQLVEGRHFAPGTTIDLIARKAVARAVSDIASMGGTPRAAMVGATLPATFAEAPALFDAMSRWCERWGCPLVGGDTATWGKGEGEGLVLSVSLIGAAHKARGPVLRSGAKAGDAVYITGRVGGSFRSGRHLSFEPRLSEGRWLCEALGPALHAMMDISDGVGRDAARMAKASGRRLVLDAALLPLHADAGGPLEAVAAGEDYELLFAADPAAAVPKTCPATGTPLTRIGRVETAAAGVGACLLLTHEGEIDISNAGWDHGTAGTPQQTQ